MCLYLLHPKWSLLHFISCILCLPQRHTERHQQFQNDLQNEEIKVSLEEMVDFTAESGLTNVVASFYKKPANKYGPAQCKQCLVSIGDFERPDTKYLVSHLQQFHQEILQGVLQSRQTFVNPENNEKYNIHLGECICEKCDQVIEIWLVSYVSNRIFLKWLNLLRSKVVLFCARKFNHKFKNDNLL